MMIPKHILPAFIFAFGFKSCIKWGGGGGGGGGGELFFCLYNSVSNYETRNYV